MGIDANGDVYSYRLQARDQTGIIKNYLSRDSTLVHHRLRHHTGHKLFA